MATEKVVRLGIVRDYQKYIYYIDTGGNVCQKEKKNASAPVQVVAANAVTRDKNYLYFIDKDGDVSRSPLAKRTKKTNA